MYKFSISRQILTPAVKGMLISASLALTTWSGGVLAQEAPAANNATASKTGAGKDSQTSKDASTTKEQSESEASTDDTDSKVTAAPTPPSEEEIEAARLAFESGTKAFEEGKFEAAVKEFEIAHKTIPSPHAEYWLAHSLDKADTENKQTAAVVIAYEKFLSNSGATHVGADKVSSANARVVELKKLLPAEIKFITQPAGASVIIDGTPAEGVTPLSIELKSGNHKVEVSLEGHEATSIELNVEGGSKVEQQVALKAIEAPAPPVVEEEEPLAKETSIVPAAVTLGLAGAGLITGTIFGIMALTSKSKFNDNPTADNADAAERNALIADMSFGIAITLGITGVVLLTADESDETQAKVKRQPRLVVAPYGNRHGGGAAAQLTF